MQITERLRFGSDPITWEQSLIRLPNPDLESVQKDQTIKCLAALRKVMIATIDTYTQSKQLPPLPSRMVPLEKHEIEFMEKECLSFRRERQLFYIPESNIKPKNMWNSIWGFHADDHPQIKVNLMKPSLPYKYGLNLVCIDTVYLNDSGEKINDNVIGFVTRNELDELKIFVTDFSS